MKKIKTPVLRAKKVEQSRDEWIESIESSLHGLTNIGDVLRFFEEKSSAEVALEKESQEKGDVKSVLIHHNRFRTLTEMWASTIDVVKTKLGRGKKVSGKSVVKVA